jgi:hypothetical protein
MAVTFETVTYTGEPRDDIQVNDSVEWAKKEYSYEFLGETRTFEVKTIKDNFVVSGVFDETACENHLDQQSQGLLAWVKEKKWTEDPITGVAIST